MWMCGKRGFNFEMGARSRVVNAISKCYLKFTSRSSATNQAVNFTAYQEMKKYMQKLQKLDELPSYQHLILGGLSGAMGK